MSVGLMICTEKHALLFVFLSGCDSSPLQTLYIISGVAVCVISSYGRVWEWYDTFHETGRISLVKTKHGFKTTAVPAYYYIVIMYWESFGNWMTGRYNINVFHLRPRLSPGPVHSAWNSLSAWNIIWLLLYTRIQTRFTIWTFEPLYYYHTGYGDSWCEVFFIQFPRKIVWKRPDRDG